MKIAFDIDDTLILPSIATGLDRDTPNYENIAILRWFQAQGHDIVLWSGSGMDWAKTWGEKLGLVPFTVQRKQEDLTVDICFDDMAVKLAKVNVQVTRINNHVSRKEWNSGARGIDSPVLGPKEDSVVGVVLPRLITREEANEIIKETMNGPRQICTISYGGKWYDVRGMSDEKRMEFIVGLTGVPESELLDKSMNLDVDLKSGTITKQ